MTQHDEASSTMKLARLMRSIAREVAYEVMDEHLDEYKHKPKKIDESEVEG
jgi:hypothetical protein